MKSVFTTISVIVTSIMMMLLFSHHACAAKTSDTTSATVEYEPPSPSDAHAMAMEKVLGDAKKDINKIGILVYDGVNSLDVMGPRYVLGQLMGAQTQLIGIKPGNIKTVMGVELVPDTTIDHVSDLDILVIPGGFQETIKNVYNKALHHWIRKIDETTTYTAAVCTGSWILAGAGLLEGKKATTNWYRAEEMLSKYGARFTDERFTRDGKYWTSAGVTAGMDMALAIVNEVRGEAYTQAVMLDMEYDPAPPIEGGTPETTDKAVLEMMRLMYDSGFLPGIEAMESGKTPAAGKP